MAARSAPAWAGAFFNKTTRAGWAHRRLLWRVFTDGLRTSFPPRIETAPALWRGARTTERSVMAMVAAVQRRAHCAPVVEDILEEAHRRPLRRLWRHGCHGRRGPEGRLKAFKKGDERVLRRGAAGRRARRGSLLDVQSRLCNVPESGAGPGL